MTERWTIGLLLVEGVADDAAFAVIPIEDLIANRMGQYASGTAPEMRGQAGTLFLLHPGLDTEYLERRVRQETGNEYGIADLTDWQPPAMGRSGHPA